MILVTTERLAWNMKNTHFPDCKSATASIEVKEHIQIPCLLESIVLLSETLLQRESSFLFFFALKFKISILRQSTLAFGSQLISQMIT